MLYTVGCVVKLFIVQLMQWWITFTLVDLIAPLWCQAPEIEIAAATSVARCILNWLQSPLLLPWCFSPSFKSWGARLHCMRFVSQKDCCFGRTRDESRDYFSLLHFCSYKLFIPPKEEDNINLATAQVVAIWHKHCRETNEPFWHEVHLQVHILTGCSNGTLCLP